MLIEAVTNNKNRTVAEIKKILSDHNAKWADPGSVMWAFEKDEKGEWEPKFPQKVSPETKERLLALLEDLDNHDDVEEIYTSADFSD